MGNRCHPGYYQTRQGENLDRAMKLQVSGSRLLATTLDRNVGQKNFAAGADLRYTHHLCVNELGSWNAAKWVPSRKDKLDSNKKC